MSNQYKPLPGLIPGTLLNLSGVKLVMPPLNLDQIQQFSESTASIGSGKSMQENMEIALPILHAAMTRNYPDMTLDDLRGLLDISNFQEACAALWKSSGYVMEKDAAGK
jgi:hypothetical protein